MIAYLSRTKEVEDTDCAPAARHAFISTVRPSGGSFLSFFRTPLVVRASWIKESEKVRPVAEWLRWLGLGKRAGRRFGVVDGNGPTSEGRLQLSFVSLGNEICSQSCAAVASRSYAVRGVRIYCVSKSSVRRGPARYGSGTPAVFENARKRFGRRPRQKMPTTLTARAVRSVNGREVVEARVSPSRMYMATTMRR